MTDHFWWRKITLILYNPWGKGKIKKWMFSAPQSLKYSVFKLVTYLVGWHLIIILCLLYVLGKDTVSSTFNRIHFFPLWKWCKNLLSSWYRCSGATKEPQDSSFIILQYNWKTKTYKFALLMKILEYTKDLQKKKSDIVAS